ncbi:MAG: HNH endonuclease [Ignavibacteriaceae bacterium]|nr:HNH endonuclease [Ignavibacteriaceae bacterium]
MNPSKGFEQEILILLSLFEQNLSAKKKDVLDHLEANNYIKLSERDIQSQNTRPEEKWRNEFAFVRNKLKDYNFLVPNQYNKWEINSDGIKYFRKLVNEIRNESYNSFEYVSVTALNKLRSLNIEIDEVIKSTKFDEDITNDSIVSEPEPLYEGNKKFRYSSYYERQPKLRKQAIQFHGLNCMACGFNFQQYFGERGENFIEVHHIKPISEFENSLIVDAQKDLIVVCSNCHRMIHRRKDDVLSLDELKRIIRKNAL